MKYQILHRHTNSVLFEADAETLKDTVVLAVAQGANLTGANLDGANLNGANLDGANLDGANLDGANLDGANLDGANLDGANLDGASLYRANLTGANLDGANLTGANLDGANLESVVTQRTILPEGDLIGWKKLKGGLICKLRIPADAKRVGGVTGRKCRAEFAVVLEGNGVTGGWREAFVTYQVGEKVVPDSFDPNPLVECSHGIHFFITRQEAEDYSL